MRFFRLRPMATFGSAFFLCAFISSFFAPIFALAFAALFLTALLILLLFMKSSGDAEKRQTKIALISLLLAPIMSLSLSAYRGYCDERFAPVGRETQIVGTVRERLGASAGYALYIIDVKSENGVDASFSAAAGSGDLSFTPGDVVSASGTFFDLGESFPDGERYLRSRGAVCEAELSTISLSGYDGSITYRLAVLREKISARIALYVPQNAPFISALAVGDRSDLAPTLRRSFSELGISHLLAISGVHMSVVFAAASLFMRPFGRRRFFVLLPMIVGFEAITGFSASAIRAGTMLAICALAELLGRRTDRVTVLSTAALLITVFSRGAVYDVGFLLSVLSVFALSILPYPEQSRERSPIRAALFAVGASVAATAAVSIVTLPVTAREYGVISLAAPLANLVFIPAISLILFVLPIFLLLSLVPPIAFVLGGAIDLYSGLVCRLARFLSGGGRFLISLDYPFFKELSIFLAIAFAAVFVARRKRTPIILAAIAASCMILSGAATEALRSGEVRAEAFSEKAGDMIAVTDGSSLYVVDSAKGSSALVRRVETLEREMTATRIEKYVFTHYHADSDVYLQKLLSSVRVREIILPEPQSDFERDLCMRMAQIALKADVRPTLIEGDAALGAAKVTLSERCDMPQSVEQSFALTISCGENAATYVTAGFFDTPEPFRDSVKSIFAETLVAGTHGKESASEIPSDAVKLSEGAFSARWKKN